MKQFKLLITSVIIIFLLEGCVSKGRYLAMEKNYIHTENLLLTAREINKEMAGDTAFLGESLRTAQQKISNLEDYNNYSQTTMTKKLKDMEGSLARQEFALAGRDKYLTEQADKLAQKEKLLDQKNKQLDDVQALVNKQNAVLDTLRNITANALNNFKEEELVVVTKDGNVYISFSENLLFAKGSLVVSNNGKAALKQLSEVLKNQPDIIVTIEGHTDNQPIKSSIIRNNWDLSVLRAASVADILVANGVYAWRIIPSGRSEYSPLVENITEEDRKMNRRTEIILSPNMRPILKLLETHN